MPTFDRVFAEALQKAHVRAHTRKVNGKVVQVREHEDSRPEKNQPAPVPEVTYPGITVNWGGEELPLAQHNGLQPPRPPFPDATVLGQGLHTGTVWEHEGKAWKRAVHRVRMLEDGPDGRPLFAVHEFRNDGAVDAIRAIADLPRVPSGIEVLDGGDVLYVGHTACQSPSAIGEDIFWSMVTQDDIEDIEETLRMAAERGIQVNDTLQLGYDPDRGIVVMDWSNAHIEKPFNGRWPDGYIRQVTDLYRKVGNEGMAVARELAQDVRHDAWGMEMQEGTHQERRYVYGSFNRPAWLGMTGTIIDLDPDCNPRIMPKPESQAEHSGLWLPHDYVVTEQPLSENTCAQLELTPLHIPPVKPEKLEKGVKIKGRPGLQLKEVSTKDGRSVRRWVKIGRRDEQHPGTPVPPAADRGEQYKRLGTKAPAFKAWFGDWENPNADASKVVNKDGEPQETYQIPGTGSEVEGSDGKPLVVYHGTSRGWFPAFDKDKLDIQSLYGPGMYFTEDRSVAEEYTEKDAETGTGPYVFSVFLNIRNPFDLDQGLSSDQIGALADAIEELIAETQEAGKTQAGSEWFAASGEDPVGALREVADAEEIPIQTLEDWLKDLADGFLVCPTYHEPSSQCAEIVQRMGYDGMTHIGGRISGKGKLHRVWIAFGPNQIKAVDNQGTFSPETDDIYKSFVRPYAQNRRAVRIYTTKTSPMSLFKGIGQDKPTDPNEDSILKALRKAVGEQKVKVRTRVRHTKTGTVIQPAHTETRKKAEPKASVKWVKGEDPFDGSPRYSIEGRNPGSSYERVTAVIVQEKEYNEFTFRKEPRYYGSVYDNKAEYAIDVGPFRAVKDAKVATEQAFHRMMADIAREEAQKQAEAQRANVNQVPPDQEIPDKPTPLRLVSENANYTIELEPSDGGASFTARMISSYGEEKASQTFPAAQWSDILEQQFGAGWSVQGLKKAVQKVNVRTKVRQTKTGPVIQPAHRETRKKAEPKPKKAPVEPKLSDVKVYEIPIRIIQPDPEQHRKDFDKEYIRGLADSIKQSGQKTAITVRPIDGADGIRYQIIGGECRYRACKLLGKKTIRAEIKSGLSAEEALVEQVIENMARKQPNPTEEGTAYRQLADMEMRRHRRRKSAQGTDWSLPENRQKLEDIGRKFVVKKTGKTRAHVNRYIVLTELPKDVREMVDKGFLSIAHAHQLLRLIDPTEDSRVLEPEFRTSRMQELERKARQARADNTITAKKLGGMVTEYIRAEQQGTMFSWDEVTGGEKQVRRQAQKAKLAKLLDAVVSVVNEAWDENDQQFHADAMTETDLEIALQQIDGVIDSFGKIREVFETQANRIATFKGKRRTTPVAPQPAPEPKQEAPQELSLFKALISAAEGLLTPEARRAYEARAVKEKPAHRLKKALQWLLRKATEETQDVKVRTRVLHKKTGLVVQPAHTEKRKKAAPKPEREKSVQATEDATAKPGPKQRTNRRTGKGAPTSRTARGIITSRADLLPPVDLTACPQAIQTNLSEDQVEGVARAVVALDKQGGFIMADGTGVGKTRQILALARIYQERGHPVLIVAPSEVIKQDWKTGAYYGSYQEDAAAVGVTPQLIDGSKDRLKKGQVGITTYHHQKRVLPEDLPPGTVVLFDEAHALKNSTGGQPSGTAKWGIELANAAHSVVYATATPMDKAIHLPYLFRAGVFEGKTMEAALQELGLEYKHRRKKLVGGKWVDPSGWVIKQGLTNREVVRRIEQLFDRVTAAGCMLKREVSLEGLNVQLHGITAPPEARELMRSIESRYLRYNEETGETTIDPLSKARMMQDQRRHLEPFKISAAVAMIKDELAKGRHVAVFVARVNPSESADVNKDVNGDIISKTVFAQTEGTAVALRDALRAEGIEDVIEMHGQATKTSSEKKRAQDRFQAGDGRVLITTVESGGTGINLDDRIGDAPRTLICLTPPFTAPGVAQMVGRVLRRTTVSNVDVKFIFTGEEVDKWNARIANDKLAMLGASVKGDIASRIQLDEGIIDWITDEDAPYQFYNPNVIVIQQGRDYAEDEKPEPKQLREKKQAEPSKEPPAEPATPAQPVSGSGSGIPVEHRIFITKKGKAKPVFAFKLPGRMDKETYAAFSAAYGWRDSATGMYMVADKPENEALVARITGTQPQRTLKKGLWGGLRVRITKGFMRTHMSGGSRSYHHRLRRERP